MKIFLLRITVAGCLLGFPMAGFSQCKTFTKSQCMDLLENYTGNGQYNGAVMFEGEEATMMQTFYSNQSYRVVVCGQKPIADSLYFEVMDYRNKLIYSSHKTHSSTFDFNVESTQQLKIRLIVPHGRKEEQLKENGCVSVLVGFKNK